MSPAPSRLKTLIRRSAPVAFVIAGLAGAAGWALASRPAEKPAVIATDPTRPVLVRLVQPEPLTQSRVLVGTIRARIEGEQGFRVAGKIASRKVQIGDRVKAGDMIALLDETDLRLSRESAEAELAAARAALEQAELERVRIGDLRAKGWSTEQAADRQKAAVAEAAGRVIRAARQVELATNAQSYAALRADNDGVVMGLMAEAGQVVAPGQAMVRIARDGDREALVAIPEQDIGLARAARAEATLWSEPGRAYLARLRELAPSADPATRTFAARFTLAAIPPDAPLGQTTTLTLAHEGGASAVRLPLSAILDQGEGPHVFVVEKATGLLTLRPVKLMTLDQREAVIGEGLTEGEMVVTLGVHTLRAGQKVRARFDDRLG
jgi:RND family efflux transporter MFP subunit